MNYLIVNVYTDRGTVKGLSWQNLKAVRPDRYIAGFAIIGSLFLLGYGVGRSSPIAVGLALMLTCMIAVPSALWWQYHDRLSIRMHRLWSVKGSIILSTVFFLLLGLTFLVFAFRSDPNQRPATFFVLVTLMVGVTALAALSTQIRRQEYLVIFQVIVIGLVLAWTESLLFPDVIGADPWYHRALTNSVIATGALSTTPDLSAYVNFPIFHLTVASLSIMTGTEYRDAAMGSVALLQIVSNVLFVYLIAHLIFRKNPAIRMLAPLVMVITPLHIFMSFWSIPNGFSVIYILPVLFLIYSIANSNSRYSSSQFDLRVSVRCGKPDVLNRDELLHLSCDLLYCLIVLFLITLILAHTITAFFMAIVLFVAWAMFRYTSIDSPRRRGFPILLPIGYLVAVLVWWSRDSESISTLSQVLLNKFSIDTFSVYTDIEIPPFNPLSLGDQMIVYFTYFGFLVLPLLGLLYMLSRRGTHLSFNFGVVGITPIALVITTVVLNITLIQERWFYFSGVLNAISLVLTCLLLRPPLLAANPLTKKALHLFPVLLICLLTFAAITDPDSNIDNRLLVDGATPKTALTESELMAMSTTYGVFNRTVATDWYYADSQRFNGAQTKAYTFEVFLRNLTALKENVVLVRNDVVRPPVYLFSYRCLPYYELENALYGEGFSRVYDCGSTRGYLGFEQGDSLISATFK